MNLNRRFTVMASAIAGLLILCTVAHHLDWGGDAFQLLAQEALETAVAGAACLAALFAARRSERAGAIAWYCWAAYAALFAAGSLTLLIVSLRTGGSPGFPSPADVMYLGAVPAAVAGALTLGRPRPTFAGAVIALLDGLLFGIGLALVGWELLLEPLFQQGTATASVTAVSVAYPTTDALILTLLVTMAVRAARRIQVTLWLLASGMLAILLADSSLAFQTATGVLNDADSLLGMGWLFGLGLIAIAALNAGRTSAAASRVRTSQPWLGIIVPLLPVGAGIALALHGYIFNKQLSAVTIWSTVALVIAGGVRQSMALATTGRMQRLIEQGVNQDELTGLDSRVAMRRLLEQCTAGHRLGCQLLLVDIDRFKGINDTYGHTAGDQLLRSVAGVIRSVLRPYDVAARLGGDEFAVAVSDGPGRGVEVARRILDALAEPVQLAGMTTTVSASIGVVDVCGERSAEELLRDADIAMYAAKARGGAQLAVFDASMRETVAERVQLEAELRTSWRNGQLVLHYQPIVELRTGKVASIEALVRWQHPVRGLMGPDAFISIAEDTGLIVPMGAWILRTACATLVAISPGDDPATGASVSVNVSARQLLNPGLVADALGASGLPAGRLIVEVTETAVMRDVAGAIQMLEQLRAMGVRIALDDFGVGTSSIANLRRLPIDIIKIDKSLVDHVPDGRMATGLLDAVLGMAASLSMRTVVEGVERADQAEHLREVGYDLAQGYLFSRPRDAAETRRTLDAGHLDGQGAGETPVCAAGRQDRSELLEDDDADHALAAATALVREGIDIVRSANVAAAHQELRRGSFDALITDLRLPDGSGWDLVDAVRRDRESAALPIVVMTGLPDSATVLNRAERLGAEYLGKPFGAPALMAKLRSARVLARERSGNGSPVALQVAPVGAMDPRS